MMIGVWRCSAVKQGMMQQIITMEMIVHVEASHRDLYFMGFVVIVDELKLVVANVVSKAIFCNSWSEKKRLSQNEKASFLWVLEGSCLDVTLSGSPFASNR